ncbi:hypothetical protein Esti_004101 [Eimeria stiedai]
MPQRARPPVDDSGLPLPPEPPLVGQLYMGVGPSGATHASHPPQQLGGLGPPAMSGPLEPQGTPGHLHIDPGSGGAPEQQQPAPPQGLASSYTGVGERRGPLPNSPWVGGPPGRAPSARLGSPLSQQKGLLPVAAPLPSGHGASSFGAPLMRGPQQLPPAASEGPPGPSSGAVAPVPEGASDPPWAPHGRPPAAAWVGAPSLSGVGQQQQQHQQQQQQLVEGGVLGGTPPAHEAPPGKWEQPVHLLYQGPPTESKGGGPLEGPHTSLPTQSPAHVAAVMPGAPVQQQQRCLLKQGDPLQQQQQQQNQQQQSQQGPDSLTTLPVNPDAVSFGGNLVGERPPAAQEAPTALPIEGPFHRGPPGAGAKREPVGQQRMASHGYVGIRQQQQQQQRQQRQPVQQQHEQPPSSQQQELHGPDALGPGFAAFPGALQVDPSLVGEGQQQAATRAKSALGAPPASWPGFLAASGTLSSSGGGPSCVGPSLSASQGPPAGVGPLASQQVRVLPGLGAPFSSPSSSEPRELLLRGGPGAPEAPTADCLLSAAAAQQHALLAIRAFVLACGEQVVPPWKQIASWAPWLRGQQEGPPHAGLQRGPPVPLPPSGAKKRQQSEKAQTDAATNKEVLGAVEEEEREAPLAGGKRGSLGPEVAKAGERAEAPSGEGAFCGGEEGPSKAERKRKGPAGGGPLAAATTAAARRSLKAQRVAAGAPTAEGEVFEAQEAFLSPSLQLELPLTVVQQADVCLALLAALGRVRPSWLLKGNRAPFHMHVARLQPSLLLAATPPSTATLAAYKEALGPLVEHQASIEYMHLRPGEAEALLEEVERLRGPQLIDSVLEALDVLGPQGPPEPAGAAGGPPTDAEALEAEALRDSGDPRHHLLLLQQQQQQPQQQQQQAEGVSRAGEGPAPPEASRGLGGETGDVLLAYNPDLKALRQLNCLVPGTRVYLHLEALNAKRAEMGLPPLPPPPQQQQQQMNGSEGGGAGGGGSPFPPVSRGPLSKFVMVEAGERRFSVPCGESLPLKLLGPPHSVLHFTIGHVVQLLQEGRLCLLRFTEREALKRRLPLLGAPLGASRDSGSAGVGSGGGASGGPLVGAPLGFKTQRGTKPACCPAPVGIEKICRCKCNHRRQEVYAQLKQRLRVDKRACLAAIKDLPDLLHVVLALPSARTYQLEILCYLFGVDPWQFAKNRQEAPPPSEVPQLISRYKELVTSKEYSAAFKHWVEEQAKERSLQQEIAADITAIGLNLKEAAGAAGGGGAGTPAAAAAAAQQDPRVQASVSQLLPNAPICVRVKALLGLPSGNEQHIRGVVKRVQLLPRRGRAVSLSINNRREEFVLLPEEVETLVAHDDLRLVRMRSRQWFAYEAQGGGPSAHATSPPPGDNAWLCAAHEETGSWSSGVQPAAS